MIRKERKKKKKRKKFSKIKFVNLQEKMRYSLRLKSHKFVIKKSLFCQRNHINKYCISCNSQLSHLKVTDSGK